MKRKVLALFMAASMVFGMASTTMAYTLTINNSATGNVTANTHSFSAYQLFTGDLSDTDPASTGKNIPDNGDTITQKVLSNVKWGSAITDDGKALVEAMKADATLKDIDAVKKLTATENKYTASAVADAIASLTSEAQIDALTKILATCTTSSEVAGTNTSGSNKIENLNAGYYFVKDTTTVNTTDTSVANDSASAYILQVLGDQTITIKTDANTVTKKIIDGVDDKDNLVLKDANDGAGYGSVVTYLIQGSIPDPTGYNYYYYYLEDILSKGLTNNKDYVVFVDYNGNGKQDTDDVLLTNSDSKTYYYAEASTGTDKKTTIYIAMDDYKDLYANTMTKSKITTSSKISVVYSATVNSDADLTTTGNPNEVTLKYSNNPNSNYEGKPSDTTNWKGRPSDSSSDKDAIGTTPKSEVTTYLTDLTIYKTDGDGKPLAGATFKLSGTSKETVYTKGDYYKEDANGTYYLLKDGTYTDKAPTGTTTSYKAVGKVTANDLTDDNKAKIAGYLYDKDNDTYYVPGVTEGYENETYKEGDVLYSKITSYGNEGEYASDQKYSLVEDVTTTTTVENQITKELTTDDSGVLNFASLGEGTYELVETKTPATYNTAAKKKFTVTMNSDGSFKVKVDDGNETTMANYSDAVYDATVINNKGTVLPSTGGMGTTIFYIVGGILVIGAGVLLVTKKRAEA